MVISVAREKLLLTMDKSPEGAHLELYDNYTVE